MKILIGVLVTLIATAACSGGSTAPAPTPKPAAVTGIDTPKSVSVVTAN